MPSSTPIPLNTSRFVFLVVLVVGAVFSRLLPHPPNFTALSATAVFSGATLGRRSGYWVPLLAMVVSDAWIGFHPLAGAVYLALAASTWLGTYLNPRMSTPYFMGAGALSALLFYFVTNFAVWAFQDLYPHTLTGLVTCYVAALPWLGNMVAGDILFAAVIVGIARAAEARFPSLQPHLVPAAELRA